MNSNYEFQTIVNNCPKCKNNKNVEEINNNIIYNICDVVCDEKDTICKECGFYYSKFTIIQVKKSKLY